MTSRSEPPPGPEFIRSLNYFEARHQALQDALAAVVFADYPPKESALELAERLWGICIGDTSE